MSYVPPPIPERWDVGQWEHAHWDGQLGLAADVAAFTLTGTSVTLSYISNKRLTAAPGSFALAATPARLAVARRLVAQPGSIAVTGVAVTLSSRFTAATGAFTLSGSVTRLAAARVLVTYATTNAWDIAQWDQALWDGSSTFIVKGYPTNLVYSTRKTLVAAPGTFTIAGYAALTVVRKLKFAVAPGAIVITGYPVGLSTASARSMAAAPGAFVWSPTPATLTVRHAYRLAAAPGAVALSGLPTGLRCARALRTAPGAIVLTGVPVTLTHGVLAAYRLAAAPGLIVMNGWAASLLVQRAHPPPVEPPWSINETMPPGELVLGIPAYIPNRW